MARQRRSFGVSVARKIVMHVLFPHLLALEMVAGALALIFASLGFVVGVILFADLGSHAVLAATVCEVIWLVVVAGWIGPPIARSIVKKRARRAEERCWAEQARQRAEKRALLPPEYQPRHSPRPTAAPTLAARAGKAAARWENRADAWHSQRGV